MRRKRSPAAPPCPADRAGGLDGVGAEEVYRLFEVVMSVADRLPPPLPVPRQHALAGRCFAAAPLLVEQVRRALGGHRELFDDVAVEPEALRRRQARALAWECLQGALLEVAARAGSLYIEDQAGAVMGAMAVVEQVRADEVRPFPHPLAEERRRALRQAEAVLAQRHARTRRPRPAARGGAGVGAEEAPPPGGGGAALAGEARPDGVGGAGAPRRVTRRPAPERSAAREDAEALRDRARAWLLRR